MEGKRAWFPWRTEQQRLQGEEALFQILLSFILHPLEPPNPLFSFSWACVIDNQNRKILLRAESDFIFQNNSLKFQMSLCHLVWLRAIQTRSVSNENLLYSLFHPLLYEKCLKAKWTTLPMFQIHLSNVNTIHDQRLTGLHLQHSKDCHFGLENISLIRMLNNPQYFYNVLFFICFEQLYFQRQKQNNFNQVNIILMTAVL